MSQHGGHLGVDRRGDVNDDIWFVRARKQHGVHLMGWASVGVVEGHRRGRSGGIENRPTQFTMIAVIDIDPTEKCRSGIGAENAVGRRRTDETNESFAKLIGVGDFSVRNSEALNLTNT